MSLAISCTQKAKLIDENKNKKDILTFGPISIHPLIKGWATEKCL